MTVWMSAYSQKRTSSKNFHSDGAFFLGELRRNFPQVLPCGVAGEGQERHNMLEEKKKLTAALTGVIAGGRPVAQGDAAMTQVAELERKWSQTRDLIDNANTPWEDVKELSEEVWDLGVDLLHTPAADLGDVAIKIQWLAEQDLDREILRQVLRRILTDIHRLQRQ